LQQLDIMAKTSATTKAKAAKKTAATKAKPARKSTDKAAASKTDDQTGPLVSIEACKQ
jgi:hypothetical protein